MSKLVPLLAVVLVCKHTCKPLSNPPVDFAAGVVCSDIYCLGPHKPLSSIIPRRYINAYAPKHHP
jgi:hypothetical protein